MIDKKYLELMNKKIDHIITDGEIVELNNYLSANENAKKYFNELLLTNEYLNRISDPEPSENLKKQITNSIDFSKYSSPQKKKNVWNIFYIPKAKYAYTFAAGLIAGIIVISIFYNSPSNFDNKDVYGTIGIENTDANLIKEIPVKVLNVSGKIQLRRLKDNFWFDVNLNSSQKIDFTITYPNNVEFKSINPGEDNNIEFSKSENFIKAINTGVQQYKLMFSQNSTASSLILIQIMQSGNIIFDDKVLLNR
jgi:hypothetical protein